MKVHYRKYFLDWQEGRLSPRKKREVDEHLEECPVCREYFREMSQLMQPEEEHLPRLAVDPYELTRIRALAEEKADKPILPLQRLVGGLAFSLTLFVAIVLGVWLGKGMTSYSQNDLQYAANSITAQQNNIEYDLGFDVVWETMIEETINED